MARKLAPLRERLFFTVEDVAELFGMDRSSARVFCHRRTRDGSFLRLKKDFYVLEERWSSYSLEELLRIANFLQVPSYVSLMTALSLHGVTTQVQRDYFESVCLRRSVTYSAGGRRFVFHRVKESYYFGFENRNGVFIASGEKAFLDAVYLWSFGRYAFDLASLDLEKLDRETVMRMAEAFPRRTRAALKKIWKN